MNHIFNMFGKSPVRPLQQHMAKVHGCAEGLIPFFEAALEGEWVLAGQRQQQIASQVGEADRLKNDLRLHLPSGWMMAFSRRDILSVLTEQDRIAITAKDIAGLILGRKMNFPPEIHAPLMNFVRRSVDASAQARQAIDELDELVETGFHGREVALVEGMVTTLDAIEGDTDAMQVEVRSAIFRHEQQLPPVDAVFMYRAVELIGELANHAQGVGGRLLLMLAR